MNEMDTHIMYNQERERERERGIQVHSLEKCQEIPNC